MFVPCPMTGALYGTVPPNNWQYKVQGNLQDTIRYSLKYGTDIINIQRYTDLANSLGNNLESTIFCLFLCPLREKNL